MRSSEIESVNTSASPRTDAMKLPASRLRARTSLRVAMHLRHFTMSVITLPRHSPSHLGTIPSCRDPSFCCTCAPLRQSLYALSLAFCNSQCRYLEDSRPTLGWFTLQHIAAASSEQRRFCGSVLSLGCLRTGGRKSFCLRFSRACSVGLVRVDFSDISWQIGLQSIFQEQVDAKTCVEKGRHIARYVAIVGKTHHFTH
jgi:hypothetical protein